ncbi:probable serine/threonine-protein kinase ndrD [Glossina fuscipes]|uniref:Probable serine/threonine-protein kinase ndrD n=1 Tax=Glossina fuscipes TaxID=7396 RepID=A0A9C5ZC41_9MUSC|nr:probable serine/threonine-protein kinase ndrD [Glossina fuscipes]
MPEVHVKQCEDADIRPATTTRHTTTRTNGNYPNELLAQTKWNRSTSLTKDVNDLHLRNRQLDYDIIENFPLDNHNDCNSNVVVNERNFCCSSCIPSRTKCSSCWHLKRKHIIKKSSFASAKNKTKSLNEPLPHLARYQTKKSISLPATPNLNHLRKTVPVQTYRKLTLDKQSFSPISSSCDNNYANLMEILEKSSSMFLQNDDHMKSKEKFSLRNLEKFSDKTNHLNNNNNNNNNDNDNGVQIRVDTVNMMATQQQQQQEQEQKQQEEKQSQQQQSQQKQQIRATFVGRPPQSRTKTEENSAMSPTAKRTRTHRLFSCQQCCENISVSTLSAQEMKKFSQCRHQQKTNAANDLERFERCDSDSVSELSSYRFVSDEDESSSLSVNDQQQQRHHTTSGLTGILTHTYSESYVDNDSDIVNHHNDTKSTNTSLSNRENNDRNNNNNNNNNDCEINGFPHHHHHHHHQHHHHNHRVSSGNTPPPICCYTNNNKANSDYIGSDSICDSSNVSKAINIPLNRNKNNNNTNNRLSSDEYTSDDCLLSTSLPHHYSTSYDENNLSRRTYLRNSLRSRKDYQPPPIPPKPVSNHSRSPSYDPQNFYRKLQKFETQNTLQNQNQLSRAFNGKQERSITPDSCELIHCFGSGKKPPIIKKLNNNNSIKEVQVQGISNENSRTYDTTPIKQSLINDENNHLNLKIKPLNGETTVFSSVQHSSSSPSSSSCSSITPICTLNSASLHSNATKRTLRYDSHGRLKASSFISQLPITNNRKLSSLETRTLKSISCGNGTGVIVKLTPTLGRKYNFLHNCAISHGLPEETEEDLQNSETETHSISAPESPNKADHLTSLNRTQQQQQQQQEQHQQILQEKLLKSLNENQKQTKTQSAIFLKPINSPNNNNNNSSFSFSTSPLSSPTSPKRSLLPKHKSQSSPLVVHYGTASPIWLSSETIESQTSSQKCLDEIQSNCSDQTTIFHFDNDCSSSSSPSLPYVNNNHSNFNSGNLLRGPLLVKRIPAIQSFGYVPTLSSSLESTNAPDYLEKEPGVF